LNDSADLVPADIPDTGLFQSEQDGKREPRDEKNERLERGNSQKATHLRNRKEKHHKATIKYLVSERFNLRIVEALGLAIL